MQWFTMKSFLSDNTSWTEIMLQSSILIRVVFSTSKIISCYLNNWEKLIELLKFNT